MQRLYTTEGALSIVSIKASSQRNSVHCDIKIYSLKYPSQHLQQQNADPIYKRPIQLRAKRFEYCVPWRSQKLSLLKLTRESKKCQHKAWIMGD